MSVEARPFNSILRTSVLLFDTALCSAVERSIPLRLFMAAPLFNNNFVTLLLFFIAACWSAVLELSYSLSTGTPAWSIFFTLLTSPIAAARVKRSMRFLSISRREMESTIKQFDVCEILIRLWKFHLSETINHLISMEQ